MTKDESQARADGALRLAKLMERHRARFLDRDPVKAALYAAKAAAAKSFMGGTEGPVAAALRREAAGRKWSPVRLARAVIERHEAAQIAAFVLSDIERSAAERIAKANTVAEVTAILAEVEQACAAV